MVVVKEYGEDHINKSLKQIDSNTWLIGDLLLHRCPSPSDTATWNVDSDNSSYPLSWQPHRPTASTSSWSMTYIEEGATPESVTSNFVRDQRPSFEIPKVLHHAFGSDRSYLFLRRVPGRTLDTAWQSLNEYWKRHYVNAIVDVCKEMAEWKGAGLGGLDDQNRLECYLGTPRGGSGFGSANIEAGCKEIGMDCSVILYHADLGPTTIIVEDEPIPGRVGIVDFLKLLVTSLWAGSSPSFDSPPGWTYLLQARVARLGGEQKFQKRLE
ncbi:uncharacterized protein L3040_003163 [Drepanopeziza brunnea f. sp. 'multigermtubi']|uniref:uncharacterized protein n=1 Tax=Drepanopeziza brunnea f. sp. 'multigermtubi' TaxID=698441 RepID=UPI0023957B26|nr:hypothetical protein L3040_003163 [Drepanopeziza brunnea f. sp. 'multigermtubi']